MTRDTSSAPSILAGIATPSSDKEYTATPTTGSPLRIETYRSISDLQITGGEGLDEETRAFGMWASALLTQPLLAEFVSELREYKQKHPDGAKAVAAALVEFLLREPEVAR